MIWVSRGDYVDVQFFRDVVDEHRPREKGLDVKDLFLIRLFFVHKKESFEELIFVQFAVRKVNYTMTSVVVKLNEDVIFAVRFEDRYLTLSCCPKNCEEGLEIDVHTPVVGIAVFPDIYAFDCRIEFVEDYAGF